MWTKKQCKDSLSKWDFYKIFQNLSLCWVPTQEIARQSLQASLRYGLWMPVRPCPSSLSQWFSKERMADTSQSMFHRYQWYTHATSLNKFATIIKCLLLFCIIYLMFDLFWQMTGWSCLPVNPALKGGIKCRPATCMGCKGPFSQKHPVHHFCCFNKRWFIMNRMRMQ